MKYPAFVNIDGGELGLPDETLYADVHIVRDAALAGAKALQDFSGRPPTLDHRVVFGFKVGCLSEAGDMISPQQIDGFLNTVEVLLPPGVKIFRMVPATYGGSQRLWPVYSASGNGIRAAQVFYLVREAIGPHARCAELGTHRGCDSEATSA